MQQGNVNDVQERSTDWSRAGEIAESRTALPSIWLVSAMVTVMQRKGMTFVFYVSRPYFSENQCGSAQKTNKPLKNKHGTSKRKQTKVWWSRSVHHSYHRHYWWNQAISLPIGPPVCSAAKENRQRLSSCRFLRLLSVSLSLSPSPCQWARAHRHSERTCAREWSSDSRTSSSIIFCRDKSFPHKVYAKTFSLPGDTPLNPSWRVPQLLTLLQQKRQTRLSKRNRESVDKRCTELTLKLTNLPTASVFIKLHVKQKLFCVEQSVSLIVCDNRRANLSKGTSFLF